MGINAPESRTRDKEEKNDRLVKITMSFDMRMFTRCFTNKSKYPNQVPNLTMSL